MSPNVRAIAIASFFVPLLLAPNPSTAESAPTRHTLADHRFLPTTLVQDPFVETTLQLGLGAGRAVGLKVPVLNLAGETLTTLDGNLGFLLLALGYQQRLSNWLSLGAELSGAARTGTTTVALIAEGATAIYQAAFTAKARILERPRYLVSGTVAARNNTGYAISPLDWAREVIDEGGTDSTSALLSKDSTWVFTAGVRGSYAFSPTVGVSAITEVTLGDPLFGNNDVKAPVLIGAACDVDFLPGSGTPVGLVGSLLYRSDSQASDDVANASVTAGLGVFYSGRKEYSVGLEFSYQSANQQNSDENMNIVQARLLTRYDF